MKPARGALLAALLALAIPARGAEPEGPVRLRLTAPVGEITVGDPVTLLLTATHPAGTVFDPPEPGRLWPAAKEGEAGGPPEHLLVERIEPLKPDPPRPEETSFRVHARLFAPGSTTVPGISLTYRAPGTPGPATAVSGSITINVGSVLKSAEEPPADIKGAWSLPFEWLRLLMQIGVVAALLLAAIWLYRRFRRRPAPAPRAEPIPEGPPLSAWERAIRDLEELLRSGLLPAGRHKEFHVRLSEILKRFLGEVHGFDALDRTTEEVLDHLTQAGAAAAERGLARQFLVACDLVKFAKLVPDASAIEQTVAHAREVLEIRRPPSPEPQAAASPAGGAAA